VRSRVRSAGGSVGSVSVAVHSLVRLGVLTGTAWGTHWYGLGYSYARKVDGRDLDAVDVPEAVVGVHDDRPAQHIRKNKHVYLSSTRAMVPGQWYPGNGTRAMVPGHSTYSALLVDVDHRVLSVP
jgi:hypothetical protein